MPIRQAVPVLSMTNDGCSKAYSSNGGSFVRANPITQTQTQDDGVKKGRSFKNAINTFYQTGNPATPPSRGKPVRLLADYFHNSNSIRSNLTGRQVTNDGWYPKL